MLTVAETERVAAFLTEQGHDVAAYSGQSTNRELLEDRLRDNQIKALVATSALGMGYDKPDLAFCIHLGSPASPVAYYQQVGRAGRALDDALAVLVPAEADERIWDTSPAPASRTRHRSSRCSMCSPATSRSRWSRSRRRPGSGAAGWRRCSRSWRWTAWSSAAPADGRPPGSRGTSTRPSGRRCARCAPPRRT